MRPLKTIVRIVAGLFLLAGLGVFGYQGYIWYMSGEWYGIDLLSTIHWLNSTQFTPAGNGGSPPPLNWFYAPHNWLGLHRILIVVLDIVPLSLILIVAGSFLFAAIDGGEKERSRIIETVETEMRNRQAGGQ